MEETKALKEAKDFCEEAHKYWSNALNDLDRLMEDLHWGFESLRQAKMYLDRLDHEYQFEMKSSSRWIEHGCTEIDRLRMIGYALVDSLSTESGALKDIIELITTDLEEEQKEA